MAAGGGIGLDPRVETLIATGLFLLMLVYCLQRLGEGSATAEAPRGFVRPTPRRRRVAVLCLIIMVTEGAMADSGGIYLSRDLGTSTSVAALAFAAFSGGMTAGRVFGDWLNRRLGAATLFQGGSALAGLALGGMLLLGAPALAVIGFFLVGIGVANGVPLVFSAAGHAEGPSRARTSPPSARWARSASSPARRSSASWPRRRRSRSRSRRCASRSPSSPSSGAGSAPARSARAPPTTSRAMRFVLSDLDGVLVDSGDAVERVWREWAASTGSTPTRWRARAMASRAAVVHGASRRTSTPRRRSTGSRPPRGDRRPRPARRRRAARSSRRRRHVLQPRARRRAARGGRPAAPAVLITSDLTERGKPHPDPYLAGAAALGADPADCLVIEDAPAGIAAARAAGMTVWA